MGNWGKVEGRAKPSNLKFYQGLENYGDKVNNLVQQHGYKSYYAGGKHGKPDLANKNYHTKNLMIYDPTSGSGGDLGHESYTDAWRKTHELAHGLTHNAVNQIYGEGKRMGKLGQRSPKEMKRAVHWEWLAAHKQRDLMQGLGYNMKDEDFHKELNTIMGDATHRAVTGKFTEPSEMGFVPHSHKIPLEQSLNMIDAHAKKLGLKHDDDTLTAKSEFLQELEDFKKALAVAPSNQVGEGALARANTQLKKRLKEVLNSWDKKTPIKKFIKAAMPALSDKYVDHFSDVAQDIAIKKGEVQIIFSNNVDSLHALPDEAQNELINGISIPMGHEISGRFQNAKGDMVRLSPQVNETKGEFSFLMRKFFGLGKYINHVHNVRWNKQGQIIDLMAEKILDGFKMPSESEYQEAIQRMKSSGDLYKLAMAELILGTDGQRSKFSMIVNGDNVVYLEPTKVHAHKEIKIPTSDIEQDLLPIQVINWLTSLDNTKLALYMSFMGTPRQKIHKCLRVKSIILSHKNELIGVIYQKVAEMNQPVESL